MKKLKRFDLMTNGLITEKQFMYNTYDRHESKTTNEQQAPANLD